MVTIELILSCGLMRHGFLDFPSRKFTDYICQSLARPLGSGLKFDKNGGSYQTFEAYCKGVWRFARSTAYQFIDSVKVIENVRHCGQIPMTESQTRPLAKLDPAQQREVWQKAVDTDANAPVKK